MAFWTWTAADVANTVLALGGFGVLLWQTRRAVGASEAARRASEAARAEVAERTTLVELGEVVSRLQALAGHIRAGDGGAARDEVAVIDYLLRQADARSQAMPAVGPVGVTGLATRFRRLAAELGVGPSATLAEDEREDLAHHAEELAQQITILRERARWQSREGGSAE